MTDKQKNEKGSERRAACECVSGAVVCSCQEEPVVLCEVCGHPNTERDALCKNCSNYLERR